MKKNCEEICGNCAAWTQTWQSAGWGKCATFGGIVLSVATCDSFSARARLEGGPREQPTPRDEVSDGKAEIGGGDAAPCPFCGATVTRQVSTLGVNEGMRWHMACDSCEALGPKGSDLAEAFCLWEKRALRAMR